MSGYHSITIQETLRRINGREPGALYLPALQRHFVWPHAKICALFDSIMRDYPIGTFLFWEVDADRQEESSFYQFIQAYSEFGDKCFNAPAGRTLPPDILGVLDGQQRLNSMFVAMLGSYAYYDGGRGCPRSSPYYYPERHFYLNPFGQPEDDSDWKYEFDLLTSAEASPQTFTSDRCWIKVGEVFYCASEEDVRSRWNKWKAAVPPSLAIDKDKEDVALGMLLKLWRKICQEPLITYYLVKERTLTEALDIFVRMNHGGIPLHFRDLLFSTIAANWKEGRDEIEKLQRDLNAIGHGFSFDVSSLMLACLVLSGNPVRMKIESFKPSNVESIRTQWAEISNSLMQAVDLVAEWSYSGNNAISLNAIIAVAVAVRHEIDWRGSKEELRMFLIRSLICGLFERRAERTLGAIRNYFDRLPTGALFTLKHFMDTAELPPTLSLQISQEHIENLLDTEIWHPRAYVLLSLLHTQHALHQHAFEKDHIHPVSGFNQISQFNLGVEGEVLWHDWKNRLPNVQLLQNGVNNTKRAKPFKEWLPIHCPSEEAQRSYLAENDIPADVSLNFADFGSFYTSRKDRLRQRLMNLLGVQPLSVPVQTSTNQIT